MKILLALFLILFEVIIKTEETQDIKQIYKYSKKVKIPVQRSIKIINARKFEKLKALESRKANIRKQGRDTNTYTAFPPISDRRLLGVPDELVQEPQPVRNRRLIAARDATIEEYPYVVSIQKDNQHWCAGALLNPRLVITTANCVWKSRSVSRMKIRAGSRHMSRGGQVAKIQEVVKHPSWSIRSLPDNDVALLFLDRNIKFSDSVHGVDLPNHAMYPVFEDAWVTSWGADRRDGIYQPVSVTLQVYHARLLDHAKCNNITQRFGVSVSHNFICLAQTGRRAPCTRDTGAPAVSDGILWGLASWGIRRLCGTERFPAMFSYLASKSNLDFITNATHYLMSDKRLYPYPDRFIINGGLTETSSITRL